jgi:hypothetical protein
MQLFSDTGEVLAFEEVAPQFSLRVRRSSEGLEISDSSVRIGITAREARKWTAIVDAEISRLNVTVIHRGLIRTVFADGEGGRWVLQWGDEVFVPTECLSDIGKPGSRSEFEGDASLVIGEVKGFVVLLSRRDSACVALTPAETEEFMAAGQVCR